MSRVWAIALAFFAIVQTTLPTSASADPLPAPTPLAVKLDAWVTAAEIKPLDADLEDGMKLTNAADARLVAINTELAPLVARVHALGRELTAIEKTLDELRTRRSTATGENDDSVKRLDARIEALRVRQESVERQRELTYDQMTRLSGEISALLDRALRLGEAASAIAEAPKADAAKKRKATALVQRTHQVHVTRFALIRTMMGRASE